MTLSQLFLLSPRGDTIIFKDFKGNVPKVGPPCRQPAHRAAAAASLRRPVASGSKLLPVPPAPPD